MMAKLFIRDAVLLSNFTQEVEKNFDLSSLHLRDQDLCHFNELNSDFTKIQRMPLYQINSMSHLSREISLT